MEIDANVLKAVEAGNPDAIKALLERHGQWLRAVIAAHVPVGWPLQQAEQLSWVAIRKQLPFRDPQIHLQNWMLQQARLPVTQLLRELDRMAVDKRDTLSHIICEASLAAIEDGSYVPAGLISTTLNELPDDKKNILIARYRHGVAQVTNQQHSAAQLCNARIACDWINASATTFTDDSMIARLIDEWLMQTIDADSHGLLTAQISKDITRSAALAQQQRVHGALYAACHPFTNEDIQKITAIMTKGPQRTGGSSNRIVTQMRMSTANDSGIRGVRISSSDPKRPSGLKIASDHYQTVRPQRKINSYAMTHMAAAAIVIIGIAAMLIFKSVNSIPVVDNTQTANKPQNTSSLISATTTTPTTTTPVQIATFTSQIDKNQFNAQQESSNNPVTQNLAGDNTASQQYSLARANGPIMYEVWNDAVGDGVNHGLSYIKSKPTPDIISYESTFGALFPGNNKFIRMTCFISPPISGNYEFTMHAAPSGKVWLSADQASENLQLIVSQDTGRIRIRNSKPILLTEGKKYLLVAYHKYGSSKAVFSLSWQLPDGTTEDSIASKHLFPVSDMSLPPKNEPTQALSKESTNTAVGISTTTIANTSGLQQSLISGAVIKLWDNFQGETFADGLEFIKINSKPTLVRSLEQLHAPKVPNEKFFQRLSCYINPPESGEYTFSLLTRNKGELFLSTDKSKENLTLIAISDKAAAESGKINTLSQRSAAIKLEKGKLYRLVAHQIDGDDVNYISVAWDLPNKTVENPIAANRLFVTEDDLGDLQNAKGKSKIALDQLGGTTVQKKTPAVIKLPPLTTGYAISEIWENVEGRHVNQGTKVLQNNNTPTSISKLHELKNETKDKISFFQQITCYLTPPITGDYIFSISANDTAHLMLSTDHSIEQLQLIADCPKPLPISLFDKFDSQQSKPIRLIKGTLYYLQIHHKQGLDTSHVIVGWQLPDGTKEFPVSGKHLSVPTSLLNQTKSSP